MIFDTHVHTTASPDGEMTPEEVIQVMEQKGLGCIFTEHTDHTPEGEPFFCVDFGVYPGEYVKYRSDKVLLGLELNLLTECVDVNQKLSETPHLDFCIGSVHFTNDFDMGYFTERTEEMFRVYGEEFYAHHLAFALKVVEASDFFDSFGHIDYISRYSTLPERNVLYSRFAGYYDALMLAIIGKGKVMELSTRRLDERSAVANLMDVYRRYKELGGRYVTLGSDAHRVSALGYEFDTALKMINEIGLKPVYFKERKMIES